MRVFVFLRHPPIQKKTNNIKKYDTCSRHREYDSSKPQFLSLPTEFSQLPLSRTTECPAGYTDATGSDALSCDACATGYMDTDDVADTVTCDACATGYADSDEVEATVTCDTCALGYMDSDEDDDTFVCDACSPDYEDVDGDADTLTCTQGR